MAEPASGLPPAPPNPQPFSFGPAPTAPGFDVADLLPPASAERLRALRLRAKEAFAIMVPFEDVRTASTAKTDAENHLRRLQAHPQNGGFNLPDTDARVIAAVSALEKASAEFERVRARSEARSASWTAVGGALAKCEDWLKNGRPGGTALVDVEDDLPKPSKTEHGLLDQIETRRRRVRELLADARRIESAPYPSVYCKQKMRQQIEALAMRGPDVSGLLEHDGEIIWPTVRVEVQIFNAQPGAIGYAEVPDMLAIDAWLHKTAMIAALDRDLAAANDDAAAMTHEARQKAEAEVMADILATERTEAALVWRAMDEKLPVEHRGDCSPQAILQVALRTVPRAIDGPSTSPLAFDLVRTGGRRR
jgi:hypothetical protein